MGRIPVNYYRLPRSDRDSIAKFLQNPPFIAVSMGGGFAYGLTTGDNEQDYFAAINLARILALNRKKKGVDNRNFHVWRK